MESYEFFKVRKLIFYPVLSAGNSCPTYGSFYPLFLFPVEDGNLYLQSIEPDFIDAFPVSYGKTGK
jgi:hypothetical protein